MSFCKRWCVNECLHKMPCVDEFMKLFSGISFGHDGVPSLSALPQI